MTGRTSGPHLHWEVGRGWNGTITGKFDPQTLGISPFGRSTRRIKGKKVSAIPKPASQVASTPPTAATVPQQIAMTPSYASGGGSNTLAILPIIMEKQVPTPVSFPGNPTNVPNMGVNSSIPALIG